MNSIDQILMQGAAQENQDRQDGTLPIAIASGVGGAMLGAPIDAINNRLRKTLNPKARTSYGTRLAGGAIAGLIGAVANTQRPNRAAEIIAKMQTGGELTMADALYVEELTKQQLRSA